MRVITLESVVLDRSSPWPGLVLELSFSDEEMFISFGADRDDLCRVAAPLWSHTVYELEKFSEELRYIAWGRLKRYVEVTSKDMFIGPKVSLELSFNCQLGHPGIGRPGYGTLIFCSTKEHRRLKEGQRYKEIHVDVAIMGNGVSAIGRFEPDHIIAFADQLYEQAKLLEPTLVPYDSPDEAAE